MPYMLTYLFSQIARLRSHRQHLEHEYNTIAKLARRAVNELAIADVDLKVAEMRRATTSAHLEKARAGMLGIDFV